MSKPMESSQWLGDLVQRSPGLVWPREWRVSLAVAVLAHIGLLYGFQTAFHHPPALPGADTVIEITMTAAPSEPVAEAPPVEAAQPAETAPAPEPAPVEPVVQPTPPPVEELKPEPPKPAPPPTPIVVQKPVQVSPVPPTAPAPPQPIALAKSSTSAPAANRPAGDGSLAKPGPDATSTLVQVGVRAKPNYLKKPEPAYPAVARRRRQEGTVLLAVKVSAAGRATRVELKHSSGHPALDAAALEAVPAWEFEPARLGTLKVDSEIEVPVRFELKR